MKSFKELTETWAINHHMFIFWGKETCERVSQFHTGRGSSGSASFSSIDRLPVR